MQASYNSGQKAKQGRQALTKWALPALFLVLAMLLAGAHAASAAQKVTGRAAEDFTLNDLNGKKVSLSSFKGKVVLLNFWATWCPPCRAEMPSLEKLYQRLKDKGFTVLAVATDRAAVDVKDYLKAQPLSFTILLDGNLKISRERYKVFMMPTTFLIDKRGVVVEKFYGEEDWMDPETIKQIEALL